MQRVIVGLLLVAAAFAGLIVELRLGQGDFGTALAVFAGVATLGFPPLYLCCKRGWWAPWQTALLGSLGGAGCALPFAGGSFEFRFLLLTLMLAGGLLGGLFWGVAIWRNDRLTCPRSFCLPCGVAYKFARSALQRRDLLSADRQSK